MRAGFLCFRPPKEPETIWLHSFSAGRIYDNAYLLASLPVLRRDKPKALVLAAVAARWMQPARRPPFLCESHLHFDGNPFAGIGADDLPVQLRLEVQVNIAACPNHRAEAPQAV